MQYDLNIRDYWRILRRRKWIVAFVALVFGAMAYVFAEYQKPVLIYEATAVVKFERMTTLVGLLVETISVSSGDNLVTQANVVRSFPVLERAAKALGMIPAEMAPEDVKQNPRFVQFLSDLRTAVKSAPEENTTLINITVTSPDADRATRIANAVAQAYREENALTRNRQIREARRFIEDQLAEVGGRLQQAEEGLRALKERRRFVSLSEETTASLTRLAALESEYDRIRRTQQETASQLQALQDPRVAAGVTPPRIFTDAGDPATAKLNATLLDLSVERENLLTTLTPEHPQIRDLNARISTARESLIQELRLKVQTFQRRGEDLQRQIRQLQQEQRTLPDVARQYTQLQREMTINETLLSQLRSKLQEVQIKEKEQVEEVSIVRPAIRPERATNLPQTTGKGVVGLLIGLTVGLVLAFVLESMDTSIGTIQDVESYLDVPVLGLIPNIDPTKDALLAPPEDEEEDSALARMRPFLVCFMSPRSTVAEAYRSLRTNVEFLSLEKNVKTLGVTSASLMEGKTTTAINLATTVAQMGKKTLLVEADLRKPFLHHAFGIPRDPGLAEVIIGNKEWRECLRTVTDLMLGPLGVEKVMTAPNIDKLHILTSGTPPPNPTEFLNSQRMTDLIASFRKEFDLVIFDCPPILPVTDSAILASKTDGTLIVYRVGKIARSALKRAKVLLENVRGKVLGIILTGLRAEISPDYEELEYYRYAYGHEPGRSAARMRPPRQAPESVLGRVGGFLGRILPRAKTILLIPLGFLLGGAVIWWYGAWPVESLRGPLAAVESVRVRSPLPADRGVAAGPAAPRAEPVTAAAASPQADSPFPQPVALPTPASVPAPAPPAPVRPFSLQVAAFRNQAWSLAYAEALRSKGLEAFSVPPRTPSDGIWNRVLVGGFDSASAAAEAGRTLRAKGDIEEAGQVLRLPYVVEVSGLATQDQVTTAVALARRAGYLPLLRPSGRDSSDVSGNTLLVEAFATLEEAEHLAALVRAGGLNARATRR